MTRILVVADDFTGACEMAAVFARPQLPIPIGVNTHTATPDAAVWVVNTETRNVTAEEARAKVEDLFTAGRKHPESILYKKIDSTLRGPIGSEVEALRSVSGCTNVLFAPALPSQGRTTVAGRQLVWGVPLEYTPAA